MAAPQKIQAVRIACDGESQKPFQIKQFDLYQLPAEHAIFTQGELSHISLLVGMPLRVFKVRPSVVMPNKRRRQQGKGKGKGKDNDPGSAKSSFMYSSKEDGRYFPNPIATKLLLNCMEQTATTPFFSSPPEWTDHVGSVMVARADRQPLQPAHITVLLEFMHSCCYHGPPQSAEQLAQVLTPAEFMALYRWMEEEAHKGVDGHGVLGVPPPFSEQETQTLNEQIQCETEADAMVF